MATSIRVTGLNELVLQLDAATSRLPVEVQAVLGRAGLNIKKDAAARVGGRKYLPAYPRSISYDVSAKLGGYQVEVGPDKDRPQGPLGNIIEDGSVNSAPIPHLSPALDAEEPKVVVALDALLGRLLDVP